MPRSVEGEPTGVIMFMKLVVYMFSHYNFSSDLLPTKFCLSLQFEDENQIVFTTDRTLLQFEVETIIESEQMQHKLLVTRSMDGNGIDILDQEFSGISPLHVDESELHILLLNHSPEIIPNLQHDWASQIRMAEIVASRCSLDEDDNSELIIGLNRKIDFPKILPLKQASGSSSLLVKLSGYQKGHLLIISGRVVDPFAADSSSVLFAGASAISAETSLMASGLSSDSVFAQRNSVSSISLTLPEIKTLTEMVQSHEEGVMPDDALMDILFTRLSLNKVEDNLCHVGAIVPIKLNLDFFKTYCTLSGQQLGLRAEPIAHGEKHRHFDIKFSANNHKKNKREEKLGSPRSEAIEECACIVSTREVTRLLSSKGFTGRAIEDILMPANFSSLCSALKTELKYVPDSRSEELLMCLCTTLTVHKYALTVAVGKLNRNNVVGSVDIDDTTTLSELRLKIYTEFEDEDLFPESFRFQLQGTRCSRNQERKRFAHFCLPTILVVANTKSKSSNQSRVSSFDGAELSKHNDPVSSDDSDDEKRDRVRQTTRHTKTESLRPRSEGKEGVFDGVGSPKAETSKLRQRKGVIRSLRKRNMRKMRWIERMQQNAEDKLKHQRQLEMEQPPEPPPPPRPTTPPPVYIEVPLPGVFTPLLSSSMVSTSENMENILENGNVVRLKHSKTKKLVVEGVVEAVPDEAAIVFKEQYMGDKEVNLLGFKVIDQKNDTRPKWKVMFDNKHPSTLPTIDYDEATSGEKFFSVFWHHSKLERLVNDLGDGYLHMKREDYFSRITSEFISQTLFDLICSWYPASDSVEGSKFAKFSREFKVQGPMLRGTDIDLIFSRVRK